MMASLMILKSGLMDGWMTMTRWRKEGLIDWLSTTWTRLVVPSGLRIFKRVGGGHVVPGRAPTAPYAHMHTRTSTRVHTPTPHAPLLRSAGPWTAVHSARLSLALYSAISMPTTDVLISLITITAWCWFHQHHITSRRFHSCIQKILPRTHQIN